VIRNDAWLLTTTNLVWTNLLIPGPPESPWPVFFLTGTTFKIARTPRQPGGDRTVTVSWPAAPNARLRTSTSLVHRRWVEAASSVGRGQATIPATKAGAFFRVIATNGFGDLTLVLRAP
jgi:hypothetical protein